MFADVMFPISSYRVFTYSVPADLVDRIRVGMRVNAPFGNRKAKGIIVSINRSIKFKGKIRDISGLVDKTPILDKELWKLVVWVSEYYFTPIGQVAKVVLPGNLSLNYEPPKKWFVELVEFSEAVKKNAPTQMKAVDFLRTQKDPVEVSILSELASNPLSVCRALEKKGMVKLTGVEEIPDLESVYIRSNPKEIVFTEEQNKVSGELSKALGKNTFSPFLLHGVTGSGKTEIYINIIRNAIHSGKTAILLLPEIALTPQIAGRFKSEFGDDVALWHSKLSQAARSWTWKAVCEGKFKVVIGARSAVFVPLRNIGVVIVDEEQENSYKQESPAPRYHARDVALMRGKIHNAVTILASATPSLESYYNSRNNKLKHLRLHSRYGNAVYPDVVMVDMGREENESGKSGQLFSGMLLDKITDRLKQKEQIILLQNRRGYSPVLRCRDCGNVITCPHCQITLAFHKVGNRMRCHFCGYGTSRIPEECDKCLGHELLLAGAGTQKIEEQLQEFFPGIKVLRVDQDTTRSGRSVTELLRKFENGEADILLGTQMIAKGLDFDRVTLVGIINGDTGMYLPDFRAGERTFQLIYQASGRSGRRSKKGEVVIQTYQPENMVIKSAALLNVDEYYATALEEREELGYPPFSWMTKIEISGKVKLDVYDRANEICSRLKKRYRGLEVRGPVPCYWEKLSDRYRQMIVLTSLKREDSSGQKLHNFLGKSLDRGNVLKPGKGVSVTIDINPATLL